MVLKRFCQDGEGEITPKTGAKIAAQAESGWGICCDIFHPITIVPQPHHKVCISLLVSFQIPEEGHEDDQLFDSDFSQTSMTSDGGAMWTSEVRI